MPVKVLRILWALLAGSALLQVTAQGSGTLLLTPEALDVQTARVPGIGATTGIELNEHQVIRYLNGDSAHYSSRTFNDDHWPIARLDISADTSTSKVWWLRYHIQPDAEKMRGVSVLLNAVSDGLIEVYLNGELCLHAGRAGLVDGDRRARRSLTGLRFACDGGPEVIAVRLTNTSERRLIVPRLMLQPMNSDAIRHSSIMHYGLFIGVNLLICLLALIIGVQERQDRTWLMLAGIGMIAAFGGFAGLIDEFELDFGMPAIWFKYANIGFLPWLFSLVIIVLRRLQGQRGGRRERVLLIATALMFAMLVIFLARIPVMGRGGIIINGELSIAEPLELFLAAVLVLSLAVYFVGALIEVVLVGIRLLRAKGYERWVGGGALLGLFIGSVLEMINGALHGPHHSWLGRISEYFSFLGIPVSIAIYLAMRSAQHSKAVARQRDDLDLEVQERTTQLRSERDRSEELLLNILPSEVAEELKNTGAAAARHFDTATILFTDFKGFTQLSEQVTPTELVAELNNCFMAFDAIITARGIEKIKTIGDAYMAAGGLPDPASSTPADVVIAALEMQAFMAKHKAEREAAGKPAFEMRVGIHTGPVVAGIVGVKKFQYDIWGDTVNTASRMESSGEVGKVNISEATYRLVVGTQLSVVSSQLSVGDSQDGSRTTDNRQPTTAPAFKFTPRGKVQAKGKGELEMFFVEAA